MHIIILILIEGNLCSYNYSYGVYQATVYWIVALISV